jgi:hypothetical protein
MLQYFSSGSHQGRNYFLEGMKVGLVNTDYEGPWLERIDARPVPEKRIVSSPMVKSTVFRLPRVFALNEALPKRQMLNLLYFSQTVLTTLQTECWSPTTGRRTVILIGNTGNIDQK